MLREWEDFLARAHRQWIPAANGTEKPTRFPDGSTLLYCYNPVLRQHAYLDCGTDLFVSESVLRCIENGEWHT